MIERNTALCPVCQKSVMHKQCSPHDWERGHIISVSRGGPDVWPNLVPICVGCNKAMGADSVFQYLVQIGKLSKHEADAQEKEHKAKLGAYDAQCKAERKAGTRCPYKRSYYSEYCKGCHAQRALTTQRTVRIEYKDVTFLALKAFFDDCKNYIETVRGRSANEIRYGLIKAAKSSVRSIDHALIAGVYEEQGVLFQLDGAPSERTAELTYEAIEEIGDQIDTAIQVASR